MYYDCGNGESLASFRFAFSYTPNDTDDNYNTPACNPELIDCCCPQNELISNTSQIDTALLASSRYTRA